MLMRDKIKEIIKQAVGEDLEIQISYPEPRFGDYSTNVALVLSKKLKENPMDLAEKIVQKLDKAMFEKVEVVKPGFVNFTLKTEVLAAPSLSRVRDISPKGGEKIGKILLEYFQPNIAKPLHVGHLRTAIIGDAIKRMLLYLGHDVESDTHMGDWGTQFGMLIAIYKNHDDVFWRENMINNPEVAAEAYVEYSRAADDDSTKREIAKQEFVALEQGNQENRKIWKMLVDASVQEFLQINGLMDILPFDHHWPESFYEDKMPAVLETLKKCKLLTQSQGAQIVDLEKQGLGVAVIVKSDGGTTYLLRDLATFIFAKQQGFAKHLYVVDNRQALHYKQLFAILALMGEIRDEKQETRHINYGFVSFKGEALSTRKGNMVLAMDVISQAEEKVAQIIAAKNPDLKDKQEVIKAVTKAALKYFDLKHNRHSDIEFDWNEVLDFEGDSGPYLQYAYARLASILRRAGNPKSEAPNPKQISPTERELLFKLTILPEIVEDAMKDYLPNILANYLYNLATLINKFYHESPVMQEPNEEVKNFRLGLISAAKDTLGKGLDLLGIKALEEM